MKRFTNSGMNNLKQKMLNIRKKEKRKRKNVKGQWILEYEQLFTYIYMYLIILYNI